MCIDFAFFEDITPTPLYVLYSTFLVVLSPTGQRKGDLNTVRSAVALSTAKRHL